MPSKSKMLDAARHLHGVETEVAQAPASEEPAKPTAKATPRKAPARKAPARKAGESTAKEPGAKRTPKPEVSVYTELVAKGNTVGLLHELGLAGGPSVIINVSQPAKLREAMDAWVSEKGGRSRKDLINGLLAAYLTDTGHLGR